MLSPTAIQKLLRAFDAATGPAEGIMRLPDVFLIWDCAERKWLISCSTCHRPAYWSQGVIGI